MVLIARMLQSQGLRVAILDVYGEDNTDTIEGIEVLHLPFKMTIPNDKWKLAPKNKIHSLFCTLRFLWQQHWYIKKCVKYIEPWADNFYCGSHYLLMSTELLKMQKKCFFWGLRSNRMTGFWYKLKSNPIEAIQMLRLKNAFMNNKNCNLFVSNEIIKEEFNTLGIPKERLIIREERCIESVRTSNTDDMDINPSFLVIGQLREEKQLPLTIEAFKKACISNSTLYLVGRSRGKYETAIESSIEGMKNIIRENRFLEYNDFNSYFSNCHFVLFADVQGESCITNGTMMEALINHRPIICPNYNPYSYYINKYHIGLAYKPNDVVSYANTLQEAIALGTEYFADNINKFLETLTFEHVSKKLLSDLQAKS